MQRQDSEVKDCDSQTTDIDHIDHIDPDATHITIVLEISQDTTMIQKRKYEMT